MEQTKPTPTLIRNLVAGRREAAEELLVFVQSFAPDLFEEASEAAAQVRRQPLVPGAFDKLRAVYSKALDDLRHVAELGIVEGRFLDVCVLFGGLAVSLAPKLRDEILLQQGRTKDLLEKERLGLADGDAARNRLRIALLESVRSLLDAASLPQTAPTSSTSLAPHSVLATESSVRLTQRSIIGAEPRVVLRCSNLGKRYPHSEVHALRGVELELQTGRILGVLGLNGSGKSTLLRILAGELAHDSGTLDWCGVRRPEIAFVPQRLRPWSGTLGDHLHQHAAYHGHTGAKNEQDVRETLVLLALEPFIDHAYDELSAGVQTRCALAEALVTRPKILVLDEPLAALDPVAQYRFLADLHAHAKYAARRLPAIVSSQHVEAIEAFADDLLLLHDGEPVVMCEQGNIGNDRTQNVFELRCLVDEPTLWSALERLAPYSIIARPDGQVSRRGTRYEIRVAIECSADTVLDSLREEGIALDYFSDLSCSAISRLMRHGQG